VVEQGGAPLRLPGWARRPGGFPAPGRRPSRARPSLHCRGDHRAGGRVRGRYRHPGQAGARRSDTVAATVAGAVPSAVAGFAAPAYPPRRPEVRPTPPTSASPNCPAWRRPAGRARAARPGTPDRRGGDQPLRYVGHPRAGQARPPARRAGPDLAAVGTVRCPLASWLAPDGGMIVFVKSSTGVVEVGSGTPAGAAVLPPNGTAWLSATFRVLVACPRPLPLQFSVSYQENGRRTPRSWWDSRTSGRSPTPGARAALRQSRMEGWARWS